MKISLFIILCSIFSWGQAQIHSVTLKNDTAFEGNINRIEKFPSKFVKERTVDVWLPKNYSSAKKYSVLYMHDGQMLFDASITWNKQEWRIDEVVSKLISENKIEDIIVVAIHNISEIRHTDYFPQKPYKSLSKNEKESLKEQIKKSRFQFNETKLNADNYLKFITKEVKPYIDSNYSVYTDAKHTGIMGSSMGGLISMYAICEYPKVFGNASCLSTHWPGFRDFDGNPIPEKFFSYLKKKLPSAKNHKIYFDYGTVELDAEYVKYASKVDEVLQSKGYSEKNYKNLKFEGENHSEKAWQKRIHIPIEFMFGKNKILD